MASPVKSSKDVTTSDGKPDGSDEPIKPAHARIHRKLSSRLALYKLHLKHNDMYFPSFRARTKYLQIPGEIYKKSNEYRNKFL